MNTENQTLAAKAGNIIPNAYVVLSVSNLRDMLAAAEKDMAARGGNELHCVCIRDIDLRRESGRTQIEMMRERVRELRAAVARGNQSSKRSARLRHALAVLELPALERKLAQYVRRHGVGYPNY